MNGTWLRVVAGISVLIAGPAAAQVVMYPTPAGVIPTEVLGPSSIYPRLTGTVVTTAAVAGGAAVTASGNVVVTSAGRALTVPTVATATVTSSRIAAAALGCTTAAFANPLAAVACASTVALVAKGLKEAGLGYGPCPAGSAAAYALVCKAESAGIPTDAPGTGYYYQSSFKEKTPQAACDKAGDAWYSQSGFFGNANFTRTNVVLPAPYQCEIRMKDIRPGGTTQVGARYDLFKQANFYVPGTVPPALPEFTTDVGVTLAGKNSLNKDWYDGIQADYRANPATFPAEANPIKADTPVTVSAPVVESAPTVTKIDKVQKADGSEDTVTTTQKERVTPTPSGTPTLGQQKMDFPTQTITNTTTVNNVSNVTTNTESTTYQGDTVSNTTTPPGEQIEIPDDYAREQTLQKVEQALNTDAAPVMPDQSARVAEKALEDKNALKTMVDQAVANQADKSGWFSWVWTPPVGTCQAATGTLPSGAFINWDYCPTVNNIRDLFGWMMALFSAWTIYNTIFKSGD